MQILRETYSRKKKNRNKCNHVIKKKIVGKLVSGICRAAAAAEEELRVYLGVKTCEVFLCFLAIVRVRVYYVDFFGLFVLRHW